MDHQKCIHQNNMKKVLTIEYSEEGETVELHLNKKGAEFLRNYLSQLIEKNSDSDSHWMTSDWGGDELSDDQQNLNYDIKLINHLKIMYWEDTD